MSWLNLFFGFNGRIGRKTFWLASLVPTLMYLPAMFAMYKGFVFGRKWAGTAGESIPVADIMAINQYSGTSLGSIAGFVALYIMLTLNAKRLHDLGRSGWWQGISFIALPLALTGFALMFMPNTQSAGFALCVASMVFSVWGLWICVQIWFFAGQPSSNDYGPNPAGSSLASHVESEIYALQMNAANAGAKSGAGAATAEPRRVVRTPSIQPAGPSGFGRRNARMA